MTLRIIHSDKKRKLQANQTKFNCLKENRWHSTFCFQSNNLSVLLCLSCRSMLTATPEATPTNHRAICSDSNDTSRLCVVQLPINWYAAIFGKWARAKKDEKIRASKHWKCLLACMRERKEDELSIQRGKKEGEMQDSHHRQLTILSGMNLCSQLHIIKADKAT